VLEEGTGIVFVLLPGGTFTIGAQRSNLRGANFDPGAQDDEGPPREIELAAFFLSKYEMTQGQWQRFNGLNPSFYKPGYSEAPELKSTLLHPVEQVSWTECQRTLERLGLVLPTEAQWEYAARAGTPTAWSTGQDRESLSGAVNLADQAAERAQATWSDILDWPELDDGYAAHAPVGSYSPNAFGLHDVHGNVWEWCREVYGIYSQALAPGDGERLGGMSANRMNRGGGFSGPALDARTASRGNDSEESAFNNLGLRPARRLE